MPPVEVVLGLFLPKHELYDRERHIKFGGHLGGFGADMFEAEINKLKEKNQTLCLPSRSLTLSDFHARSRFARSTIPEEKWGLLVIYFEHLRIYSLKSADLFYAYS